MRFIGFEIENFKGIEKTALNFSKIPHASIFTLVGLNESGKTTILEAINSFSPDKEGVETLYADVFKTIQPQDLIPKVRKGNFTGNITVTALIAVDNSDRKLLQTFCRDKLKAEIDVTKIPNSFQIQRVHSFHVSRHVSSSTYWDIDFELKKRKSTKIYRSRSTEWEKLTDFIGTLIPQVCYFPTFLTGFPEKIYLSNPPEDAPANNAYYVQIIQDILDSIGGNLSIKTHIVNRVERTIEPNSVWNGFGFLKTDEKQQIDQVMFEIGTKVTDVVFDRWNEIFGIKAKSKTIDIEWQAEPSSGDSSKPSVYLRFWVRDGKARFNIAERSLGFRWFFCFLLFTQFRVARRNSAAVFLFDEPASNLHSKAQAQLLQSFSHISTGNNMIMYSTHSPYMIEPRWLEGAFIVSNDAIDFSQDTGDETIPNSKTNIHAKKYREFVDQNPSKITYFQPILDKLDYAPTKLEIGTPAVFMEGKNDFYMMSYFNEIIFKSKSKITFMPSSGANDIGPLISFYTGWGKDFLVILDDDAAGQIARDRYIEEWFLTEKRVLTIGDIIPKLKGKKIEKVLSSDALNHIAHDLEKKTTSKKDIGRFFQQKYAKAEKIKFDAETLALVEKLLSEFAKRLR